MCPAEVYSPEIGNVWAVDTAGGFMYSDELSNTLRTDMQPMMRYRQFCDATDASSKAKHAGDKYHWNIYSDVETQGGVLVAGGATNIENNPMPETKFAITQGTLTMVESGNSVPYSGMLDDMSLHPVKQIIHKALKNDANKAMEILAHGQFDATLLVVGPAGAAGDSATQIEVSVTGEAGLVATDNDAAMTDDHVKAIILEMKERNIPAFDGSNYMCIGRPKSFEQFRIDLEAKSIYVDMGFGMMLNGEIGRSYDGCRFFEQTTIINAGWNKLKSDECYFFGEDTVMEGIIIPEEIRGKIPGDYGRSKGVAWYAINGFGIVHNVAGAVQNRVVKWGSREASA